MNDEWTHLNNKANLGHETRDRSYVYIACVLTRSAGTHLSFTLTLAPSRVTSNPPGKQCLGFRF